MHESNFAISCSFAKMPNVFVPTYYATEKERELRRATPSTRALDESWIELRTSYSLVYKYKWL